MDLMDFIGGAIESIGLNDIVGDFLGSFDFLKDITSSMPWVNDLLSGAITNAAVTAISGGDIGKAALFGAAGSLIGGSDMLGSYGNEIGAAVSGYGLAEANGGNGLLSAGVSALGANMKDRMNSDGSGGNAADREQFLKDNPSFAGTQGEPDSGIDVATEGGKEVVGSGDKTGGGGSHGEGGLLTQLKKFGLVNAEGETTVLGEMLGKGAMGMMANKQQEDLLDKQQDYALEREQHQADVAEEKKQNNIRFFTSKTNPYSIKRG